MQRGDRYGSTRLKISLQLPWPRQDCPLLLSSWDQALEWENHSTLEKRDGGRPAQSYEPVVNVQKVPSEPTSKVHQLSEQLRLSSRGALLNEGYAKIACHALVAENSGQDSPDGSPDGRCPAPSQRLFGLVTCCSCRPQEEYHATWPLNIHCG